MPRRRKMWRRRSDHLIRASLSPIARAARAAHRRRIAALVGIIVLLLAVTGWVARERAIVYISGVRLKRQVREMRSAGELEGKTIEELDQIELNMRFKYRAEEEGR